MYTNAELKLRKTAAELSKKGVESITISALCKKAGISRGAFYLYYQSIEDFTEKTLIYTVEKIDEQLNIFLDAHKNGRSVSNLIIFTDDDITILRFFIGMHNYMDFSVKANEIIGSRFKKRIIEKQGEAYFNKNKAMLELLLNGTMAVFMEDLLKDEPAQLVKSYYYVSEIIKEAFPEGLPW